MNYTEKIQVDVSKETLARTAEQARPSLDTRELEDYLAVLYSQTTSPRYRGEYMIRDRNGEELITTDPLSGYRVEDLHDELNNHWTYVESGRAAFLEWFSTNAIFIEAADLDMSTCIALESPEDSYDYEYNSRKYRLTGHLGEAAKVLGTRWEITNGTACTRSTFISHLMVINNDEDFSNATFY